METSKFYTEEFNKKLKKCYDEIKKIIKYEKLGKILLLENNVHLYNDKYYNIEKLTENLLILIFILLKFFNITEENINDILKLYEEDDEEDNEEVEVDNNNIINNEANKKEINNKKKNKKMNNVIVLLKFDSEINIQFIEEILKKNSLLEEVSCYIFTSKHSSSKINYKYEFNLSYSISLIIKNNKINKKNETQVEINEIKNEKNDNIKNINLKNYENKFTTILENNYELNTTRRVQSNEINLTWFFSLLKKIQTKKNEEVIHNNIVNFDQEKKKKDDEDDEDDKDDDEEEKKRQKKSKGSEKKKKKMEKEISQIDKELELENEIKEEIKNETDYVNDYNSYSFCFSINCNDPKCLTPYRNPQISNLLNNLTNFLDNSSRIEINIRDFINYIIKYNLTSNIDINSLLIPETFSFPMLMPIVIDNSADIDDSNLITRNGELSKLSSNSNINNDNFDDTSNSILISGESNDSDLSIPTSPNKDRSLILFDNNELNYLNKNLIYTLKYYIKKNNKLLPNIGVEFTLFYYTKRLIKYYQDSIHYLEELLRYQLIKAISRNLTTYDFTEYMNYHYNKIFLKNYLPLPFNYSIRRDQNYSPDGYVRIYSNDDVNQNNINTFTVNLSSSSSPTSNLMSFSISNDTKISFKGQKYLHGILFNSFSNTYEESLTLELHSRQFSSFIVLLGQMISSTEISIKHAILLRNKDSLKIPLLLEAIPSLKQFNDTIQSLSIEQQEFAKAYRSMQLETSMFGMCLIQVRPQLERVLNLPVGSLIKEIELSQKVLTLFKDYQINSDVLSYEKQHITNIEESNKLKINKVKENVEKIYNIINSYKEKKLKNEEKIRQYNNNNNNNNINIRGDFLEDIKDMGDRKSRRILKEKKCNENISKLEIIRESLENVKRDMNNSIEKCIASPSLPVPGSKNLSNQIIPLKNEVSDEFVSELMPSSPDLFSSGSESIPNENEVFNIISNNNYSNTDIELISLPNKLDEAFYKYCSDDNILSTTIKVDANKDWTKLSYSSIISTVEEEILLNKIKQDDEKKIVINLLDCLTKSGGLVIEDGTSFHLFLGFTHQFDNSIMDTLVKENINPINKVEKAAIVMQSVLNNLPFDELVVNPKIVNNIKL